MEENDTPEPAEEQVTVKEKSHDFPRSATGFVFGYLGSKVGERIYDVALKAIRERKLAKLKP